MNFADILSIALFFIFAAAFAYVVIKGVTDLIRKRSIPVQIYKAKVVSKTEGEGDSGCAALFEDEQGSIVRLSLTRSELSMLRPGDVGTLSCRDGVMLRFEVSSREPYDTDVVSE